MLPCLYLILIYIVYTIACWDIKKGEEADLCSLRSLTGLSQEAPGAGIWWHSQPRRNARLGNGLFLCLPDTLEPALEGPNWTEDCCSSLGCPCFPSPGSPSVCAGVEGICISTAILLVTIVSTHPFLMQGRAGNLFCAFLFDVYIHIYVYTFKCEYVCVCVCAGLAMLPRLRVNSQPSCLSVPSQWD